MATTADSRIQSSPKAGTRLFITGLFATTVGKVSNLQRFISQEEINISRLLRNSIFIFTRNSCISLLRMLYNYLIILFRGRSLFISWEGGGWAILGGGHEKNSTPNGGGGSKFHLWIHRGVTNMISISFSGIKMLWFLGGFAPQTPSPIFIFFSSFKPHFSPPPPKNENRKKYAYAKMPSVILLWQCIPSLDHTQVQTFYKVYIVSDFSYTKVQFTTPPSHQKCYCSMSGNRKL